MILVLAEANRQGKHDDLLRVTLQQLYISGI